MVGVNTRGRVYRKKYRGRVPILEWRSGLVFKGSSSGGRVGYLC